MSCCGDQRAAARLAATSSVPMTVHSASRTTSEQTVAVRYRYAGEIDVRGRISGRVYHFTDAGSTPVALSDARLLVAGGQFVVAK